MPSLRNPPAKRLFPRTLAHGQRHSYPPQQHHHPRLLTCPAPATQKGHENKPPLPSPRFRSISLTSLAYSSPSVVAPVPSPGTVPRDVLALRLYWWRPEWKPTTEGSPNREAVLRKLGPNVGRRTGRINILGHQKCLQTEQLLCSTDGANSPRVGPKPKPVPFGQPSRAILFLSAAGGRPRMTFF